MIALRIVHFECVFLSLNINIVVDFVRLNLVWDFCHVAHTSILFVCRLYRFLNINVFLYVFKKLGCPSIVLYSEMAKIVTFSIHILVYIYMNLWLELDNWTL